MGVNVRREVKVEVVKSDYKFGFYFDDINDNRVWTVSYNPVDSEYFILTERVNGNIISVRNVRYGDVNNKIKDICGLFKYLVLRPGEAIKKIIGEDVKVVSITVKDLSEKHEYGFEWCQVEV